MSFISGTLLLLTAPGYPGPHCGKKLKITYKGISAIATVRDEVRPRSTGSHVVWAQKGTNPPFYLSVPPRLSVLSIGRTVTSLVDSQGR